MGRYWVLRPDRFARGCPRQDSSLACRLLLLQNLGLRYTDALRSHLQGPCDVKWGPVFSTSRQASRRKDFVVLVPDEAFLTGLPWAHIQPWKELQVCALSADTTLPEPPTSSAPASVTSSSTG